MEELEKLYKKHHFTDFIRGKKVIIVGPDPYLKGKKQGSYIDSFDLVIRHNTVFDFLPFDRNHAEDYGKRTDILYLSPTCMKNYAFKPKNLEKMRECGIKYVVYQNGNRDHKYILDDYCFPKPLEWFKSNAPKYSIKLHYSHHTTRILSDMMTKTGDQTLVPRTGFISIFDMIIHEAGEIEIVGMSFYHGGGHLYRKDVKKTLDPLLDHKGRDSPHDSNVELMIFKEWLNKHKIKIDLSFLDNKC